MAEKNVTFTVASSTGRTMSIKNAMRRLSTFEKRLNEMPGQIANSVPRNFYANMSKTIRFMWRSNYLSHEGWRVKSHTSGGARTKDFYYRRRDTFKLVPGDAGQKAAYSSASFGLRTGNILNAIKSKKGTDASIRTSSSKANKGTDFTVSVNTRFKTEAFDGAGNSRTAGGGRSKGRKSPTSTFKNGRNYAERFSREITKPGQRVSALVKLTQPQMFKIRRSINEVLDKKVTNVIQREAFISRGA